MQVSVETTQGLERKLTVWLPAQGIQEAVNKKLHEIRSQVRLDGFRPGKVPFNVVKKRYSGHVRLEVLEDMIQSSFRDAVQNEDLKPVAAPSVEPIKTESIDSEDFGYTATFEIYPEFELASLAAVEIERPVVEITSTDVDELIEKLRKQHANWNTVEREAKNGDQVIIDFTGTIDGEEFEGGKGEKVLLELGSGTMIAGFEEQLIGIKPSADTTVNVTFPKDYENTELASREVQFAIHLHEVREPELLAVDEEFAKKLGIEEGGVDALREDVQKNMQRELKQALKNKIKTLAMDALADTNTVDVPQAIVQQEVRQAKRQALDRIGRLPGDDEALGLPDDLFEEMSAKRAKLGLLAAEVVSAQKLQASDEKVRETIMDMASAYQDPEQVVSYYYQNQELLGNVQNIVLEQEIVDWVLSEVKVNDKAMAYTEFMSQVGTA